MSYKKQERNDERFFIDLPLDETIVLLVGAKLLNELVEAIEIEYSGPSEVVIGNIVKKLMNLLPDDIDEMTTNITQDILNSFFSADVHISDIEDDDYSYPMYNIDEKLPVIKKAVKECFALDIEYYYLEKEEVKKPHIYPYGMQKHGTFQLLVAYCPLVYEIKVFRVDRIKSVAINEEKFQRPENFDIESYLHLTYQ